MTTETWNTATRRTIVGYFSSSEDARRAIDELVSEGFGPGEIGAAFRAEGSSNVPEATVGTRAAFVSENMDIHPAVGLNSPEGGTSTAGVGSDSNAVTPSGLSTGGGTEMSGAGRPGRIPGGEIPSTIPSSLPHSLPSSLRHDGDVAQDGDFAVEGQSQNEIAEYDYAYSREAFESAFFGMGIGPAKAKHLSDSISRGGAIVTVDAVEGSAKAEAIEKILAGNGGSVREEFSSNDGPVDAWDDAGSDDRVQLFGQFRRVYPGYVSASGAPTRRAS